MCGICGCGKGRNVNADCIGGGDICADHVNHHDHVNYHTEGENHHHEHSDSRRITVEADVLLHNNQHAEMNRRFLDERNITAFNLMSSPGAGKTALLEETLKALENNLSSWNLPASVIVGDQRTDLDAQRLQRYGQPVEQIETGDLCHLDAVRVGNYLKYVVEDRTKLLFIENVGNLICPAAFNLGEHVKVALLSVTEGEDKPLKYPAMFSLVDVVIITKIDLLPYLDFDLAKCCSFISELAPKAKLMQLSAKTKEGFDQWMQFVCARRMPVCA